MIFANYYQQDRTKNASFEKIDRHHTYNPTYTNRLLRAEFLRNGVELNNPDLNISRNITFSLLHDAQEHINPPIPKYLIATENPYICPLNCDESYLKDFKGVFTWNKNLFHLPNVTQLFIPNKIHYQPTPSFGERPIFSCIINANKAFSSDVPSDLYKERIKVIRWYEKHAPTFFSLYGLGWGKPEPAFSFNQKIVRRFKRLATQTYGFRPFPSYAGEIENKSDVYTKTKFAYCYENVANLPNYISEKIFDCFFGGCIPVYWGSNTISDHIPKDCFIDRRDFESTRDVHKHLLKITESEFLQYQKNIEKYLTSSDAIKFDTSRYVSIVIEKIFADLHL